jgi:hypothetical protein
MSSRGGVSFLAFITFAAVVTASVMYLKGNFGSTPGGLTTVAHLPKKVRIARVGNEHLNYKRGFVYFVELPGGEYRAVLSEKPLPPYFQVVDDLVLDVQPPEGK